jgi:hypothetical protein
LTRPDPGQVAVHTFQTNWWTESLVNNPRVEYSLTELGVEVGSLTNMIADWSVVTAPSARAGFSRSLYRRAFRHV